MTIVQVLRCVLAYRFPVGLAGAGLVMLIAAFGGEFWRTLRWLGRG